MKGGGGGKKERGNSGGRIWFEYIMMVFILVNKGAITWTGVGMYGF